MTRIAFIGFGEAGSLLSSGLAGAGADIVACYDILLDDPPTARLIREKAERLGITTAASPQSAVAEADIVISAVTTSRTLEAALAAAPYLKSGQIYLDLNSTSPPTKREAASAIEAGGADFVEAAVMDLVPPHGYKVPMLLAGARAQHLSNRLSAYGMSVEAIGETIGDASAVKMVRSVFMKGFSAVFLEMLVAAKRLNAEEAILSSLQTTFPGLDWPALADYYLPRLIKHSGRQAGEMKSVAATLHELGIEPITAEATGARLAWLAQKNIGAHTAPLPEDFRDLLALILEEEEHS